MGDALSLRALAMTKTESSREHHNLSENPCAARVFGVINEKMGV